MSLRPKFRRIFAWLLVLVLAALVLTIVSGGWLLRTESGRDFLLLRINNLLPAGATLTWDSVQGTLSEPLEIRGIRYRDGETRLDAARLRADYALWPLASRRIAINTLELDGVVLQLPRDDAPFELPRWPDILPTLDMPVTISVQDLRVRDLKVSRAGAPLLHAGSIRSRFTLGDGLLRLETFAMASDRGDVSLAGHYLPAKEFDTDLRGSWRYATTPGAPPASLALRAKGDFNAFTLSVDGNAPAPLRLRLVLKDGRLPNWTFDASSEQFLSESLGLPADAPWAFDVHASGQGGRAQLRGRVVRDGLAVGIEPSRLRLDAGVITLEPLLLTLPQGPVRVDGTLALEGEDPRFDLRVGSTGLRLQPATTAPGAETVIARGEMKIAGRWQAWTLAGAATARRGREEARLTLAGTGDDSQLRLQTLRIASPTGSLQGQGHVAWQPQLAASIDAKLAGFDPGYFFPDYPGAVNGRLVAKGQRAADGLWRAEGRLTDLGGRLRGRAVSGQGKVDWQGRSGSGDLTLAIGSSRLAVRGRFGDQLDLHAEFSPLDLSDLLADASGRLTGRLDVTGPRAAPTYRSDLRGTALQWGEDRADSLVAEGTLPGRGGSGRLQLRADGLRYAGQDIEHASLLLTGSLAALRVEGELAGESGTLALDATAAGSDGQWRGRLQSLRLAPATGATWTLQVPAAYRVADGNVFVERACLRADGPGGELCLVMNGRNGTVHGDKLPLALIEPWLRDESFKPFGDVDIDGRFARGGAGWGGDVKLRSPRGGLRLDPNSPREVIGYSDLSLDASLQGDRLSLALATQLPEDGRIVGRLSMGLSSSSALSGEVTMDINRIEWLELLSVDLANPKGQIDGHVLIGGTVGAPTLGGSAKISQFTGELPALGVKLTEGSFGLEGDAAGSLRITGQLRSGAGVLRAEGALTPRNAENTLQLTLRGDNLTAADTANFDAVISPDLQLAYGRNILRLRGVVVVPKARVDLERLDSSLSVSPDVVVLDPRDADETGTFLVDTNVEVQLGNDVRLKGYGLDGRLRGNLRVVDQPGRNAYANGTLDVRGSYTVYAQTLQIRQGRLSWNNAAYDNPQLDIRAEREIEDITVGVRVRGSALAPQSAVYSSPQMQESEAMSYLVLGRSLTAISGDEAQRVNASVMALNAGTGLLAQQLGGRLGLDQAGVTESRALGGSVLSIGKRISPRLFISYGVSLAGTGQLITLKYLIRRGFDVSIESGTESAASLNWRKEK